MPGEPVRAKECRPATCRDSRQRRHQTPGEVVLSGPAAAASRRVWLSDVPTSKAACSCPVLFPAEPPRTKGFQTACPPDRFGSSILSARELRKRRRFPWLHLQSTSPSHLCFGKVFPNMGAPPFNCSWVAHRGRARWRASCPRVSPVIRAYTHNMGVDTHMSRPGGYIKEIEAVPRNSRPPRCGPRLTGCGPHVSAV